MTFAIAPAVSFALTDSTGPRYSGPVRVQPAVSTPASDLRTLRRALSRAVTRVCPRWLVAEREDIVQVAMTKVARVMDGGKSAEEITSAYLARAAYHAVVDEIRRQRRRRGMTAIEEEVERTAVAEGPSPEAVAEGQQLGLEIRDCLSQMARTRRVAVALHLEGRGATEIASMFEWKRKQADNLVYRGMGDLRRCLTNKGLKP